MYDSNFITKNRKELRDPGYCGKAVIGFFIFGVNVAINVDKRLSQEGNILNSTLSRGPINVECYPGSRKKVLWDKVSLVAIEAIGQAVIVFDGIGKIGDCEATFVKSKCWRLVVRFSKWIVEEDCISVMLTASC